MIRRIVLGASLALGLLVGGAWAAEALKSGPQPGQEVTPFEPLNVTGEFAGEEQCLVCLNGGHPVAAVFAREVTPAVADLIKKLDEATARNDAARMGSFVVVLSDDKGAVQKQLKDLARKENLRETVLALDRPEGPKDYDIARDADVTVLLYVGRVVKANHAYRKGEFQEKDIDRILADLPKILPKQ